MPPRTVVASCCATSLYPKLRAWEIANGYAYLLITNLPALFVLPALKW